MYIITPNNNICLGFYIFKVPMKRKIITAYLKGFSKDKNKNGLFLF